MTTEVSALNLADDFREARECADAERWMLTLAVPLEVWATMASTRAPEEAFQARLLWSAYPTAPPSLKFRDPATGRLDLSRAWPLVRGFRPSSLDACVNWCAEGFALHPEWAKDARYAWSAGGNPLLRVLRILQEELDEHFRGRAA